MDDYVNISLVEANIYKTPPGPIQQLIDNISILSQVGFVLILLFIVIECFKTGTACMEKIRALTSESPEFHISNSVLWLLALCFSYCVTWLHLIIHQESADLWFQAWHCQRQRCILDICLLSAAPLAVVIHRLHVEPQRNFGFGMVMCTVGLPVLVTLIHNTFIGIHEQRFIAAKTSLRFGNESLDIPSANAFCETYITAHWMWISCLEWLAAVGITCFAFAGCLSRSAKLSISADFYLLKQSPMQESCGFQEHLSKAWHINIISKMAFAWIILFKPLLEIVVFIFRYETWSSVVSMPSHLLVIFTVICLPFYKTYSTRLTEV